MIIAPDAVSKAKEDDMPRDVKLDSRKVSPLGERVFPYKTHSRPKYPSLLPQGPSMPRQQARRSGQPPIWQQDSPNYEGASSVPSLSLIISDTPTQPYIENAISENAVSQTSVQSGIDKIDTLPSRSLPVQQGGSAHSELTERTAALEMSHHATLFSKWYARNVNPLDQLRWWLLHPGRIEFILWFAGAILLISVTCMLFLVAAFSFEWIAPGQQSGMIPASEATGGGTLPAPTLSLLDQGPLRPGQTIRLQGKGFSAHGRVIFTYDDTYFNQDTASGTLLRQAVQCDAHGEFIVALMPGNGPAWKPGRHLIVAHDLTTHRTASLPIVESSEAATPTPTPSPETGNQPGRTWPIVPTSVPPTPAVSPTVAAGPIPTVGAIPTPTVDITPTPTVDIAPTPVLAPSTPTPKPISPMPTTTSRPEPAKTPTPELTR